MPAERPIAIRAAGAPPRARPSMSPADLAVRVDGGPARFRTGGAPPRGGR